MSHRHKSLRLSVGKKVTVCPSMGALYGYSTEGVAMWRSAVWSGDQDLLPGQAPLSPVLRAPGGCSASLSLHGLRALCLCSRARFEEVTQGFLSIQGPCPSW